MDWIFGLFPALKTFWLHPAGKLSGGQKQMLAVARAICEPRALIDAPRKRMSPALARHRPITVRSVVVLPAPLRPSSIVT